MSKLECALADSQVRLFAQPPVLSILILGHRRALAAILPRCRPAQFAELWTYNNTLRQLAKRETQATQAMAETCRAARTASDVFTRPTAP
jgi:hypothetical protein